MKKMARTMVSGLALVAVCGMGLAQPGVNPPKTVPSKALPGKVPSKDAVQPPTLQPVPSESDGGLLFADPTIQFEKLEFDFGKIFDDQAVEAEFKFTNTGGGALVITNVQTSCGCTTPDWDRQRKQYNAGESGVIKARFDPAHKSGMQTKTVTVMTNDRSNPSVVLNIKTNITPMVVMEPTYQAFEPIQKGGTSSKIIKVTGRKEGFALKEVTVSPPEVFAARVLGSKKVEINGEMLPQTEIEVTMKAGSPVGRWSATMQVQTNDEKAKPMPLGLSGEVLGDLTVTPNQAMLGVVAPGADFASEVKVTRKDGKPWLLKGSELRSINADPNKPEISIATTRSESGDTQTFKLTGKAPTQPGYRFTGELVVSTDIPGEETVRVRVMLTVRPNAAGSPGAAGTPGLGSTPGTKAPGIQPTEKKEPVKPTGTPAAGVPGAGPGATPAASPK
jgi:hypothetical protein